MPITNIRINFSLFATVDSDITSTGDRDAAFVTILEPVRAAVECALLGVPDVAGFQIRKLSVQQIECTELDHNPHTTLSCAIVGEDSK